MSSKTMPDGPSPAGLGITVGTRPSAPLIGREVVEPLGRERLDVVEHRRGVDEHLPVAGEPGALALRTVGRDVAGIAEEALTSELVQGIEAFVAARELADRPEVAVHDDGTHALGIPLRRARRRSARTGSRGSYAAARIRRRPGPPRSPRRPGRPAAARPSRRRTRADSPSTRARRRRAPRRA